MLKLPGVEAVDVSLTKAMTDIRFRPDNTVTLTQLREIIKNGGFKSGEAQVTASGKLVRAHTRLALDLAPAKETLTVEADPANPAAIVETRKLADGGPVMVEIHGAVGEGETLRVKSITRK
jgi:hypothetical protein